MPSFYFTRSSGRDYNWTPSKPNLSSNIISWLESLPVNLTSKKDKSQWCPIIAFVKTFNANFALSASIVDKTDEYGRPIFEVEVNTGERVSIKSLELFKNDNTTSGNPTKKLFLQASEEFIETISFSRYDRFGLNLLRSEIDTLDQIGCSIFFGPQRILLPGVDFSIVISESSAKVNIDNLNNSKELYNDIYSETPLLTKDRNFASKIRSTFLSAQEKSSTNQKNDKKLTSNYQANLELRFKKNILANNVICEISGDSFPNGISIIVTPADMGVFEALVESLLTRDI